MAYQLWELDSRNCIAEFASRNDALAAVREMVRTGGALAIASLLLAEENTEGDLKKIAAGEALARLATGPRVTGELLSHPAQR